MVKRNVPLIALNFHLMQYGYDFFAAQFVVRRRLLAVDRDHICTEPEQMFKSQLKLTIISDGVVNFRKEDLFTIIFAYKPQVCNPLVIMDTPCC